MTRQTLDARRRLMAETLTVERAAKSDFDELMDMLLVCFQSKTPDHARFEELYPDLYRPTDRDMSHNYVVRLGGRIAGCVGVFPISVSICDQPVVVRGIGGVSALPDLRGRGLMATLMDRATADMVADGMALSWLGGDRRRYMTWGYEVTACGFHFGLGSRAPGYQNLQGKASNVRTADLESDEDWDLLWRQAARNPKLAVAGRETLRLKYQRLHQTVYVAGGPDEGGHIVMKETPGSALLTAWAGEPEAVGGLVVHWMENHDLRDVAVDLPWYPDCYCPVFKQLMCGYSMSYSGSLAVVDLARLLETYKPHLDQRVAEFGLKGSVRLAAGSIGAIPRQEVALEADGRELHITSGSTTGPVVELNRHQIVELMFTPLVVGYGVRLDAKAKWLTNLFPLPFFLPKVFNV